MWRGTVSMCTSREPSNPEEYVQVTSYPSHSTWPGRRRCGRGNFIDEHVTGTRTPMKETVIDYSSPPKQIAKGKVREGRGGILGAAS